MNESTHPPMGVTAEVDWRTNRMCDLRRAIIEYGEAEGHTPFPEWQEEYARHVEWFGAGVPHKFYDGERHEPPLGVMPEDIWRERRVRELDRAIRAYAVADGYKAPQWWYVEYYTHMSWLGEREEEKRKEEKRKEEEVEDRG